MAAVGGVIEVCFITPDANGIHGEPEMTTFPISDREITLLFCIFASAFLTPVIVPPPYVASSHPPNDCHP
jgi:hypothetical protein